MRRRSCFTVGAALLSGACALFLLVGCSASHRMPSLQRAPTPFHPPHPEEFTLANGIQVLFLEDRELPIVRGVLYLQGGSLRRGALNAAAVPALGALLRDGGAGRYSADELDGRLERLSASLDSSFGDEFGTVSFAGLSPDLKELLEMMKDVITRPRFERDRLSLWKGQVLEGIRRRKDSADSIGAIALSQILFPGSVLGEPLVSSDIASLSEKDLRAAYTQFVRPEGAIFAVAGDTSKEDLRVLLERTIGQWSRPCGSCERMGVSSGTHVGPPRPPLPEVPQPMPRGVYFIEKPFEQATVLVMRQGPKRLSPNYIAIEGFNQLFGSDGSFASKLVQRIRTELGLAYTVMGGVTPGMPVGKNIIALQTKASSAGVALGEALTVLNSFKAGEVTAADIEDAIVSTENSLIFRYESSDRIVQRKALLRLLDFPESYDDTFIPLLRKISPTDVSDVARREWDLSDVSVLVVGNEEAIRSVSQWISEHPTHPLAFEPPVVATFDEKMRIPR